MSQPKTLLTTNVDIEITSDDYRWGTPEMIATYRAQRLACDIIIDLCCASGFQSFAFAKTCKKVMAIDIDPEKIERAKENAKKLNITNIEFVVGDVLESDIINLVASIKPTVIFCDPERLETEQERTIESIMPNISELLDAYHSIQPNIAIELPPQIKQSQIQTLTQKYSRFEQEYLSVHGKLNRLTLYFGTLKTATKKAVILPEHAIIQSDTEPKISAPKISEPKASGSTTIPKRYLFEVDPAIVKAELITVLIQKTNFILLVPDKTTPLTSTYLTSEILASKEIAPFFKNTYQLLAILPWVPKDITIKLKQFNAKQVTLRYHIEERNYWRERAFFERELTGEKPLQLMKLKDQAVILEKVQL